MRTTRGQTVVEAALSCGLILSVSLVGFILMCQFHAKNILTKWAAIHSRCVATTELVHYCRKQTTSSLKKYFGFNSISVTENKENGGLHTKIKAQFIGIKFITALYDFGASEFKRTSHE